MPQPAIKHSSGRAVRSERAKREYLQFNNRSERNRDILARLERGLVIEQDLSLGPLVRPSDADEPIQRWFRYREGYTAELCRRIIQPDDTYVVDPFCGFGSTLVAAARLGVESLGFDVSPLAAFVSTVKTRAYSDSLRVKLRRHTRRLARLTSTAKTASAPTIRILPKLFHPDILHGLLVFRSAIDAVRNKEEREFLLFAWIAILERVSNVYREGNGIKYRNRLRRGNIYSVTPYDEWQANRFPADKFRFVRDTLLSQLQTMLDEATLLQAGPEPLVFQRDASSIAAQKRRASLVLFSPPYCNCFNYIKAYKLELWMAGFIRAYPDIRGLTTMGLRSRVESLLNPVIETYPSVVEELIALMDPTGLWSAQLPDLIRGYFADMQVALSSIFNGLKKHGRCVIIVGNSAYGSVLVPSDLLLTHIASSAGFQVEKVVITRHLTTSSQQKRCLEPVKEFLRESIIHLRKN